MVDGEVRHDLLLLDSLKQWTEQIDLSRESKRVLPPVEIDMGDLPGGALGGRRGEHP
jgi:hypothetical protein